MEFALKTRAGGDPHSRSVVQQLPYPAPGFRDSGSGTLYHVGNGGFSWASSVMTGTNAYYLSFYYGGIYPNNNNYRAYGLQLRCLQE